MTVLKDCEIIGINAKGASRLTVAAIRETSLRIVLNGHDFATLQCTGLYPEYLAAGFLFCNRVIERAEEIVELEIEENESGFLAKLTLNRKLESRPNFSLTSGSGLARLNGKAPQAPVMPQKPVCAPQELIRLAAKLEERSELYRASRGCHNSTLCSAKEILFFCSDIGRHNAIDAIAGKCLLEGLDVSEKILLTTGRIAGEIACKAARCGFAVLASSSVATSLGADMAKSLGLTLVGNITPDGCWIYNNTGSIKL